jgi:hypothetical protein
VKQTFSTGTTATIAIRIGDGIGQLGMAAGLLGHLGNRLNGYRTTPGPLGDLRHRDRIDLAPDCLPLDRSVLKVSQPHFFGQRKLFRRSLVLLG